MQTISIISQKGGAGSNDRTVEKSSIITWHHINLLGEYDYSDEKLNTIATFQLPKILELKVL